MSMAGVVFFLAVTVVTTLLVVIPLLRRDTDLEGQDIRLQKQRERLLVYYERVLTNLRDLDEDHATGKMPDDTYEMEREEWMQRGVQVLKAIDSLEDHSMIPASVHDDVAIDEAIDTAIEAAIASYRTEH